MSLQNNPKRQWVLIGVITLVVYVVYKIITGYFGPVPLRINVSNADVENIVVRFTIRGMVAPLKGGHEFSRYTLHEEVKLVKANELTEFPKAYMWMAMEPVEYVVEVYHPALYSTHKVVKLADLEDDNNIPITEISASLISELIDSAKKQYDSAAPQQQERIKSYAKDQYHIYYHWGKMQNYYIPALKRAHQSPDEIYRQVKPLVANCEKLFTTFAYGEECGIDEVYLRREMGLVQK